MATLLWRRDIGQSFTDAKTTLTSWDGCMSKAYCKWPVIIAIVLGSLFILSLVWCIARCLCCGVECCCGCLSCCNSCCPSPRRKQQSRGYQQAPPTPAANPYYNQYQSPAQAPVYASGGMGYRGANVAQTATFDAPGKSTARFNEDALPAMPSWENATSRKVETYEEDVELEKLDHDGMSVAQVQGPHATTQESLLPKQESGRQYTGREQNAAQAKEMGSMSANPYHDYQQHRQVSLPSPYASERQSAASPYAPDRQGAGSPYAAPTQGAGGAYMSNRQHLGNSYASERSGAGSPYASERQHSGNPYAPERQGSGNPYASSDRQGARSPYAPTYQSSPAIESPYGDASTNFFAGAGHAEPHGHEQQYRGQQGSYEPSVPPSYHTGPPSDIASPVSPASQVSYPGQGQYQAYQGTGRKPVQGSWREV